MVFFKFHIGINNIDRDSFPQFIECWQALRTSELGVPAVQPLLQSALFLPHASGDLRTPSCPSSHLRCSLRPKPDCLIFSLPFLLLCSAFAVLLRLKVNLYSRSPLFLEENAHRGSGDKPLEGAQTYMVLDHRSGLTVETLT